MFAIQRGTSARTTSITTQRILKKEFERCVSGSKLTLASRSEALLGHLNRAEQSPRFIQAFLVLKLRDRVGDDTGARLHSCDAIAQIDRADRDARIQVVRVIDIKNCSGVDTTRRRLELVNNLHCANLRRARHSARRKTSAQRIESNQVVAQMR